MNWGSGNGRPTPDRESPVLILGGAGFIGTNVAHHFLRRGRRVIVFDNLSRPGVERNVDWLLREHGDLLTVDPGDVRDGRAVARAVRQAAQVYHFAAQVAVTASLSDPVADFDVNARGTLNVLEALRGLANPPPLLMTSTNKVYGSLDDIGLRRAGDRYEPVEPTIRARGVPESRALDFHSPYGCSKGAADQYVLDYARTFRVPALVFRMSCIYGPHQFGTEDQGWVAHFLITALRGEPLTLYGDGAQVRDVLFVEDLVEAMAAAHEHIARTSGRAFNIGGGVRHTTSLLELLDLIEAVTGERPACRHGRWRPGDQRYYVSDCTRFTRLTGWRARTPVAEGVRRLYDWLVDGSRVAVAERRRVAM